MEHQSHAVYYNTRTNCDEPLYIEPITSPGSTKGSPTRQAALHKMPATSTSKGKEQRKMWKIASIAVIVIFSVTSLCISVMALFKENFAPITQQDKIEQEMLEFKKTLENLTQVNSELRLNVKETEIELRAGNEELNDGWIGLHNGYQYKLTGLNQSYNGSKENCREWGASLASFGIQDMAKRRTLVRALNIRSDFWIGLNDLEEEGEFTWENGRPAAESTNLWRNGEPNNTNGDEDCVLLGPLDLLVNDEPCGWAYKGLCEKALED